MHVDDPRMPLYEGAGPRHFNMLHPCGVGKSKYQALFHPLSTPGATDFRQTFFHASPDPAGEELGTSMLRTFDAWRQTGVCTVGGSSAPLTGEQLSIIEEGYTALDLWFPHKRSHPETPKSFTDAAGWMALRQALHSNTYWLSATELQCIAACWSCRV